MSTVDRSVEDGGGMVALFYLFYWERYVKYKAQTRFDSFSVAEYGKEKQELAIIIGIRTPS